MKWSTYLICFVLIIVGTFCGIGLYKEVKAESYINGSIDISNKFSQQSFNYSATSVVFYHEIYEEIDTYSFEKELLKVDDFNGEKKTYKVLLNDYVLLDCDLSAGSIFTTLHMDFYDTNSNIVCNGELKISIKFLSGKTTLSLSTMSLEQSSFFEQYFADNGIRLQVLEII